MRARIRRAGPTGRRRRNPASGPGTTEGAAAVGACGGQTAQVPGDPYSPPCYAFSGDNGGATNQGVTDDEIVVTVRRLEGPSAAEIFADISGRERERLTRGLRGHDPRARPSTSRRASSSTAGSSRSSSSGARATARRSCSAAARRRRWPTPCASAKEFGAFADISGITIPYADALARQGVVNFGAPYPSREWFVGPAPLLVEPVPRRHQRRGVRSRRP